MDERLRLGAAISGGAHLAVLLLAAFGADWFWDRETQPLQVTEIELVNGTDFDAAVSTAPVVPNTGPSDLSPPQETPDTAPAVDAAAPRPPAALAPIQATQAPVPRPDRPELALPPPPTDVPTEAPRPSIAEIPSPDPLPVEAATPESPAATEPLQPLASAPSPDPAPRPAPPPDPEPVQALEPTPPPPPDQPEPDPTSVAEAQPEAPVAAAPKEARLPVARPAERAAASQAAAATRRPVTAPTPAEEPAAEPAQAAAATPTPPKPAGGSTSAFAAQVSRGEKDALRLGIKQYFSYNGNRSDKTLQVVVAVTLDADGKIVGQPELLRASGGDANSQRAIFQAGRRALIRAQQAGEFAKLPPAKYTAWKLIHVRFTLEDIGFQS